MDCEHKLKVLEQEIESLKEENRLLKEKLSSSEKNFDGVSFKEKYAVRIFAVFLKRPKLLPNDFPGKRKAFYRAERKLPLRRRCRKAKRSPIRSG